MMILLFPLLSFAQAPDGKERFRAGLRSLEDKNHDAAIANFTAAYHELPVVGDHALFYASRAYLEKGDNVNAMEHINKLVAEYPGSPLKQQAESMIIIDTIGNNSDMAIELLVPYVYTYPEDEEMKFLFARLLKDMGLEKMAEDLYRELFISAGPKSGQSYEKLRDKNLGPDLLLSRGNNLLEQNRYVEAEQTLRAALKITNDDIKKDILKGLGLSLFRQKKYTEAALIFLRVDDLYTAAKAFLRAGKPDLFEKTLEELISKGDESASELLVAKAIERNGEGKHREAIEILLRAVLLFPENSEKAMWHIGWTNFREKRYEDAAKVFQELYDTYDSNKYLYWNARSMEKRGESASHIYVRLNGHGYYAYLARMRTGPASIASFRKEEMGLVEPAPMERIDTLIYIGLVNEAVHELELKARVITTYKDLIGVAYRLNAVGRYKNAISLLTQVPEELRPDDIFYPFPYRHAVRNVSSKYAMDPHLIISLIREESRFDADALSSAGAMGLMQLMPHTAKRMAGKIGLSLQSEEQIHNPEINIKLGTHYLHGLLEKFGSVFSGLAAYNAGDDKVREWLSKGLYDESYDEFIENIPYMETRNYVKRIIATYSKYQQL
jgi:soluble lytic murein transglycosylase